MIIRLAVKKRDMKKIFLAFLYLILFSFIHKDVMADGLKLNSFGAKAMSMGGAYVGLADDYSAIFWNPAGLANLSGQSFSFFGAANIPSGTYKLDVYSPHRGSFNLVNAKTKSGLLNFSGLLAYFRSINDRFVVGVGLYSPANNRTQWKGSDFTNFSPHAATSNKWMSQISLTRISPAISYKVNNNLSIGAWYKINNLHIDFGIEYSIWERRSVESQSQLVWPPDEFDTGWQFPLPGTYSMTIFTPCFSLRFDFNPIFSVSSAKKYY
jgi:long-chain fatty acid transport protein